MLIKPRDKSRVLRWFQGEHPDAFPHVELIAVKSVSLQNRMIDRQPAQRVVIIFEGLVPNNKSMGVLSNGRTGNFTWFDSSADAPNYLTDLNKFWRHISEYLWEDLLAFDDLYDYAVLQHGLTATEELHNVIHIAIRKAVDNCYDYVDLTKIYNRHRSKLLSAGYDKEGIQELICTLESALEDAKIPIIDHVVQTELIGE